MCVSVCVCVCVYIYTVALFYTLGVEYYSTPQVKTEQKKMLSTTEQRSISFMTMYTCILDIHTILDDLV